MIISHTKLSTRPLIKQFLKGILNKDTVQKYVGAIQKSVLYVESRVAQYFFVKK